VPTLPISPEFGLSCLKPVPFVRPTEVGNRRSMQGPPIAFFSGLRKARTATLIAFGPLNQLKKCATINREPFAICEGFLPHGPCPSLPGAMGKGAVGRRARGPDASCAQLPRAICVSPAMLPGRFKFL